MAIARICVRHKCCIALVLLTGPVFAQSVLDEDAVRNASPDLRGILQERSALRRELKVLEQETKRV